MLRRLLTAAMAATSAPFFDAHSHIHLSGRGPADPTVNGLLTRHRSALMSTVPGDWEVLQNTFRPAFPARSLVLAYGLHPWFAHRYAEDPEGWLEALRGFLERDAGAIVGEIGLDKRWITPDTGRNEWDAQMEVFTAQLDLATELQRPISVHCVQAQGVMFDMFRARKELPPRIYLHSFGGSKDMVKSLTKIKGSGDRFYFGFSHVVNTRSPKTPGVIAEVPGDRILLESDLEDPGGVEEALGAMLDIIAEVRGMTVEEAARVTAGNAERFYQQLGAVGTQVEEGESGGGREEEEGSGSSGDGMR